MAKDKKPGTGNGPAPAVVHGPSLLTDEDIYLWEVERRREYPRSRKHAKETGCRDLKKTDL